MPVGVDHHRIAARGRRLGQRVRPVDHGHDLSVGEEPGPRRMVGVRHLCQYAVDPAARVRVSVAEGAAKATDKRAVSGAGTHA